MAEAVGLSTCNRCELYMVGADADAMREAAVGGLGHLSGHAAERLEPMLYVHRGELAARHLFGVAGGLDSMVPGEAQILAQIREAYESAYEWDTTGPVTNRLFHQALEAGKRVRHETAIGEGGASPASVAAELAAERLGDALPERAGAGRGRRAGWPSSSPPTSPRAAWGRSRSPTATPTGPLRWRRASAASAVDFADLRAAIAAADVVVASTSSPEPLIAAGDVPPGRRVLIDLAVPRDIDPDVAAVDGASLHTIDDLEAVVERTISLRHGEADHASADRRRPGRGLPRLDGGARGRPGDHVACAPTPSASGSPSSSGRASATSPTPSASASTP